MKFERANTAIIFALPQESQDLFSDYSVYYTGLGKINAAFALSKIILESDFKNIINLGTAGSRKFKTHSLVECTGFVQRDMDLSALNFKVGETPFDDIPGLIKGSETFSNLAHGICGSGDSFEVGEPKIPCDLVDMEAYALAKVCQRLNKQFISIKYISDGCDHSAGDDWANNLVMAAKELRNFLDSIT